MRDFLGEACRCAEGATRRLGGRRAWGVLRWALLLSCAVVFCAKVYMARGAIGRSLETIVGGAGVAGVPGGLCGLVIAEVVLMLLGFVLSGVRWQLLARGSGVEVSLSSAVSTEVRAQVLASLTPLGLGEHYARLVGGGELTRRARAMVGTVGVQWIVVLSLGLAGLVWMRLEGGGVALWREVGCVSAVLVAVVMALCIVRGVAGGVLGGGVAACCRELVFCIQLTLLLEAASGECFGLSRGVMLSLVYYMYLQYVPALGLADVCPKGGVGLLVMGGLYGEGAVLAATIGLWLLNCVLPVLAWVVARVLSRVWLAKAPKRRSEEAEDDVVGDEPVGLSQGDSAVCVER